MIKNHNTSRLRRIFGCNLLLLIFTLPLTAQHLLVTGRVTDGNLPISGASIIIKNSTIGAVSDFDGRYSITAKATDTLQISYLGYRTVTVPVQGRRAIDVVLQEDIEQLAAVEITGGYYSLAERTKTGNVVKIGTDQLQQQVIHSPMEALQGRVAGLEVQTRTGLSGQAPMVTLRGQGSIRSFSDIPLYIIDGVPIESIGIRTLNSTYDTAIGLDPLATLDPSLIESIEILKDADATAIYGSRGANGVIIINTKRGQAGKTKLELQSETGVSWVGKFMKLMNTEQYLEMRLEAFENDGVAPTNSNAPDLLLWDQNRYTDWQKELIGGTAEFQKHQATISGGTDQTSFLISGGFQKEGTVFPGDFGFQNNNLLANINHRSQDSCLQLNTSINYGYRKSNLFNVAAFVANSIRLEPNAPAVFDEEGNVNWELDEFGNPTFSNTIAGLANPNINRVQSLQWNGNLSYRLLKGLSAKLNIGINQLSQKDKLIAFKENISPLMNENFRRTTVIHNYLDRKYLVVEPQLHYSSSLVNHKISGLVGTTFQKNENREMYLRGRGYFSDSQVNDISLAEDKELVSDENVQYRYAALFGRLGYSFRDRYHLNLTGRRDGSSRFGEKNRFGNFGAASIAWEFHKENLITESLIWLSYGKLRGSYGTTGSDNIGDYQYRNTYSTVYIESGSLSNGGLIPSRLHNPYYQWEKNTKLELALDIGLLDDRILLASSWYRERSGNQLIGLSLPSTTGFSSVSGNFPATVENSGWEFLLQTTPIQMTNFKWDSNLNLTIPKNRLVDFPYLENSSYASRFEIGKSLNISKFYHYTGIDSETGKYTFEDVNGDHILNKEDLTIIEDMSRKFYGGWYNSLQYKNWSFSFLFEFVKQKGTDPVTAFFTPGGQANMPTEVLDRSQKNISSGKHQAFTQNYDPGFFDYSSSDANIVDASFIRMKSMSLNYQIPPDTLEKIHVQQAHLYINAQNLFTISPYKGFDPQSPGGLTIPALTSIHLGIKLTL